MARRQQSPDLSGLAGVRTLDELAAALRALRRRHARRRRDSELTYREIAARTGWSHTTIGEYLTGKTLAPIDRFDALVVVLGATPAEQGALATARDRVAEQRSARPPGRGAVRQLPADVAGFVGRVEHLATLDTTGAAVTAICGTAGVGKTALAVHWAHRVADRFPDGQLYLNLRGFDPGGVPVSAAEAIRGLLATLGVPPSRLPSDVDGQAAVYRDAVAGRRLLILLDDARDPAQVRPLLPGTAGCLVLVTSRSTLSGLVAADGVRSVVLDVFGDREARELLIRRLGPDRVAAEPDAVDDVVARCAGLPLALAIVAARAATRPRLPLRAVAAQLGDTGLAALATGDDPGTDLRSVFASSYGALSGPAARLFRLLGPHLGPEIGADAAASLAGGAVKPLLDELTSACLLDERAPGRYTCHDLLRTYASDLATPDEQRAATHRLLDHYLHRAHAADLLLDPVADPSTPDPPVAGVGLPRFAGREQAADWFRAEHPVLRAVVERAAATGWDIHCVRLAWSTWTHLDRCGLWFDQLALGRAAVTAAARLPDSPDKARAHRLLAHALTRLGKLDDAATELSRALDVYDRTGDRTGQAHTHYALGFLLGQGNRASRALGHARRALTLYRAVDDTAGQASTLNQVGWYQAVLGNHRDALGHCAEALALHTAIGDRVGQAGAWDSLGYAHHRLGDHTEAVTCYESSLALHRELGNRYYEATTLTRLGDLHAHRGDHEMATASWRKAVDILDDLEHPDAEPLHEKLARPPLSPR